ncbi:MAG TPA: class F sortase [Ktedonobacteraceae bacterium]
MKKFLLYAILALLVVVGLMIYNLTQHAALANISSSAVEPWQPAQLSIPALKVNAPVMNVGKTAQGLMDAPVSQALNSPYWSHVFWYAPGAAPGQTGNAVLAGHVDRVGGDPAVFWYLKNLAPGDDVYVTTVEGQKLHFVVERAVSYAASVPSKDVINAVFGPSTGHHLNLITCSGVWTGNGYDQRLVVFTTQVN